MNYQLDEIDKKILDFLVENTRMPFTEIAKQMEVSAGTIHVRVKKMEDAGIILGSSLNIDYGKLDYHFTAFIGILLTKSNRTQEVLKELSTIPNVIEASVISGKYNIFCKVKAKNNEDEKRIITRIIRNKTIQTITCFAHERKRSRYSLSFTTIRIRRMCDCLSFTF